MPPVTFPMSPSSIGTEIFVGGAAILGVVFASGIGFYLIRTLFKRLKGAI